MTHDISGVINSLPMFFDEDGIVDFRNFELYMKKLVENGEPKLFYAMAYNTRIQYLDSEDLVELHRILEDVSKSTGIPWVAVPPYKASTGQLHTFFEKIDASDLIYGASILFPERVYEKDRVFFDYFSVPNKFGLKTLAHEMKLISGLDGELVDWKFNDLCELQRSCELVGIKEDSKNDTLTNQALGMAGIDIILAGGGVTQLSRVLGSRPKSWLAGVSLAFPEMTYLENKVLRDEHIREVFINNIEKPFFKLCAKFGWHRVHKASLHINGGFPIFEPHPMSTLSTAQVEEVRKVWASEIRPAIDSLA